MYTRARARISLSSRYPIVSGISTSFQRVVIVHNEIAEHDVVHEAAPGCEHMRSPSSVFSSVRHGEEFSASLRARFNVCA